MKRAYTNRVFSERKLSKRELSKSKFSIGIARALTAVLLAVFMMGMSFAGATTVTVTSLSELNDALSDASSGSDDVTINFDAGLAIDLGSTVVNIPSNVTINLSGGTLSTSGILSVSGSIAGGALVVNDGGTLVRLSDSSITATITVNGSGVVRAPLTLSLENTTGVSTGAIAAISYYGESGTDTSSFVCKDTDQVLYTQMTGSGYTTPKVIDKVITESGYVFRLGTKNTDTLSLVYLLSYSGLTGAKLTTLNPTSYTESDASITLTNPTMDGYTFVGWTCAGLGVTAPQEKMVIPAGTSGDLSFVAIWVEGTLQNGMSGSGSGGSSSTSSSTSTTTTDAATEQAAAAATDTTTTTTKRVKQASSSTKVTFSSDENNVMPTLETVKSSSSSFPWGLAFGGLAGLGVAAYAVAKYVDRKKNK